MRDTQQAADLLDWYDRHARTLPWRVSPADRTAGVVPDPYRIWLSEIMLQQTTVAAVKKYYERFTFLWPNVADLAAADDADVMGEWAGLGYYARARNLLKCARTIAQDYGGTFPDTHKELLKLPGIGPYTASAISSIAFDRAETVVDGNVERVISRVYNIRTPLPASKPEITETAKKLTPKQRPGDYAQAIMDLGATICTPKSPACGICPWQTSCQARTLGTQAELPFKSRKAPKPTRLGIAYVVQRSDGALLLERRPNRGLLGGMLGWPGSDWNDAPTDTPPMDADWYILPEEARHTFTHFHLRLQVRIARVNHDQIPDRGNFVEVDAFAPSKLPSVMQKVFKLARDAIDPIT
ncbi:A/G-specific adenine glycosylase [Roseovarius sp. EL26]|uniref:A/G-specific adenine glycosylase n=1 Tax=Roseovarius sp. EL26 TaxID=2126672 RepID=UPI000EA3F792|nr:A/G-specific adenine glycosylase [Roseovarius sp. EL26]